MISEISTERMKAMAAEAVRCLDLETIKKGKQYYQRNLVKWSKVFGLKIYAAVDDGNTHTVTIAIDNFSQSTCTCAKKRFCEHIAALFYYYYNSSHESKDLITMADFIDVKTTPPQKTPVRGKSPFREKNRVPVVPAREGPVRLWYQYFEYAYYRVKDSKKSLYPTYLEYFEGKVYFLARLYGDFSSEIAGHCQEWPSPTKTLYLFHGALYFMDLLEKQHEGSNLSYLDTYQLAEIMDDFMKYFRAVRSAEQSENLPFLKKAVDVVREALFRGETRLFDWLFIYRLMCVTSFVSREWVEKESASLKDLTAESAQNKQIRYFAALGLASLRIAAGRNGEALALLQNLEERRLEDLLFYPEYYKGVKEWGELLAWLRWLAPDIKTAHPDVLEDICEYCFEAAKNSSKGEEFIRLVRSWLPRSITYYANYLMDEGRYREWAELFMSYRGYTWENTNKSVLRHLEARDPAALLPLYHQWAAQLIEGKNRKSYQAAVRLLKKIRTLYNRQKMSKEWDAFISRLASHYSRLRALQEELKKGKLIS